MNGKSDLYAECLGIPPGPRPPHLYELLGLEPFCDDLDRILVTTRERMACIKPYEDHPERSVREEVHEIMNYIGRARAILRDPAKKEHYDRELADLLKTGRPAVPPIADVASIPPKSAPVSAPKPEAPPIKLTPSPGEEKAPTEAPVPPKPPPLTVGGKEGRATTPQSRGIQLIITEELGGEVDRLRLTGEAESSIGRDDDCQICLGHASVSPRHARLTFRQGRWYLTRDDRQAEIIVNGSGCTQALLSDGDVIGIGVYELHVEL